MSDEAEGRNTTDISDENTVKLQDLPFSFSVIFKSIFGDFIKEYPALVAWFLILIVLTSLVNTWLLPTAQGKFIDKLKSATPETLPWMALGLFLFWYCFERSLQLGMMYVNQHMMPRFVHLVRMKFFRSTIFEFQRHSQNIEQAELISNLSSVPMAVNNLFHYIIYVLALQSLIALGCTVYLGFVDWRLGVLSLCVAGVLAYIFYTGMNKCMHKSYRAYSMDKEVQRHVLDKTNNIEVILQERLEEHELNLYDKVEKERIDTVIDNFHCYFQPKIYMTYITVFLIILALVVLILKWKRTYGQENAITVGKVVALISVTTLLGRCYDRIRESIGGINVALGTMYHEGYRLNSSLTEARDVPTYNILPWMGKDAIQIQALSFTHQGGQQPIFDKLSLSVPNHTASCLLGPSGSGKTTLFRILTGSHPEYEGKILLHGRDMRTMDVHEIRAHFQVVTQNPKLFDNTVMYNIVYGHPHINEEQVHQLIRDLKLPSIYQNLTHGLQTRVGAEGKFLSGGQRQATMLLRALFSTAPIILLDEPTSNLDPDSKELLLHAIHQAGLGRTILMITHDESTAKYCHVVRMPARPAPPAAPAAHAHSASPA